MKTFLEELRDWGYLKLLKFYYWLQLTVFKKALDIKRWSLLVLDAEIRILEPSLRQIGEVDSDDFLVEYISRSLTHRETTQEIAHEAQSRSDLVADLINRCRKSSNVCTVVANYFLAEAYAALQLKDNERMDRALNRAREFIKDVQPFETKNIYQVHAKLKKRFGVIRLELAERSSIKMDIQMSQLVAFLGVISAVLVLSGYLYTTILLGALGVDASLFFSLPDYLSASMGQIHHAAIPTVLGLAVFVFGLRQGSMQSRLAIRLQSEQRAREGKWIIAFTVLLSCKVAWDLYSNEPTLSEMQLLGILASFWLSEQIAYKFFVKPLPAHIFLVALFTFCSYAGAALYLQIHDLKAGKWKGLDDVKITLKKPLSVSSTSLVMVVANNNYIFTLSKENNSAYAIPRENVELAEIARTE